MIPVSRPSLGEKELSAVGSIFDSGWLGMGSSTYQFEEDLKQYLGCRHAIAVNTGTSALHIALEGFGVGPGDEVILPSITYAACVQAILSSGATPVFCECRPDDLLIDVDDLKNRLTKRTRAIMPVHYCGQSCDLDALHALAAENDIYIIEDAAHAFGSTYKEKKVGSFGHATCFSFDPIKIITCGEGGAVTLQDDEKAELIRRKRILGIDKETWHRYKDTRAWSYAVTTDGYRYHMSNINAAIGIVQLEQIDAFIADRRDTCRAYDTHFKNLKTIKPLSVDYATTAPFMYIVRVLDGRRDQFINVLKELDVDTGIHYIPNHIHPYFEQYTRGELPVSDTLGEQIVTLPLFTGMPAADRQEVVAAVLAFEEKRG